MEAEVKLGRGVWSEYKARLALAAIITASLVSTTQAQQLNLGEVSFPTSAQSEKAQAHFLRGVAALHSFWYPVALDGFRKSITIEPNFVMGYWGEEGLGRFSPCIFKQDGKRRIPDESQPTKGASWRSH
jgi:hypothetical protein